MKIVSAEFIRSCDGPEQFPRDDLPEVAFVGRSNVGKSSLINSLLNRKGLAKVSGTPGKTRTINFFRVTTTDPSARRFYVVDLPGYGYARVAKSVRSHWRPMIERYLTDRQQLRGVLLLVDARGTERHDGTTIQWLQQVGPEPVVVATRLDKLTRGARRASLVAIREALNLPAAFALVPYSSVTHEGRDELWRAIRELLGQGSG
ncbi:MAG: ribosome biogenesis GTP-binding protein YihA/YsxC [Nitrospiraceae bacterium]